MAYSPPILLTYAGITDTLAGWSRRRVEMGMPFISHGTLYQRYSDGWPVWRILSEPPHNRQDCMRKACEKSMKQHRIHVVGKIRDSISGHARRARLQPVTLWARMESGRSVEEALAIEPVGVPWLAPELKLLLQNLELPLRQLAPMLPRHTPNAIKVRRSRLRREMGFRLRSTQTAAGAR